MKRHQDPCSSIGNGFVILLSNHSFVKVKNPSPCLLPKIEVRGYLTKAIYSGSIVSIVKRLLRFCSQHAKKHYHQSNMRGEIRKALRQVGLLERCPECEIEARTVGEEFYWNGAKRHLRCPECGYEFQIEFRITGNRFKVQVVPPGQRQMIDLEITDEEREYLRHELGKLKLT